MKLTEINLMQTTAQQVMVPKQVKWRPDRQLAIGLEQVRLLLFTHVRIAHARMISLIPTSAAVEETGIILLSRRTNAQYLNANLIIGIYNSIKVLLIQG